MSAIQATDDVFDPFVVIHQSVTTRLQTVEAELETAENKSRELEASLDQVREQAEESRVVEKHLLNNLKQFSPSEVQETFANIRETQLSVERVQLEYEALTARRAELKDQGQFLRSASTILADLQRMYGDNGGPQAPANGDKQFRDASRQVFQIIEEERMRIARDMHDGPAQSMANLVLQAELPNVHKHARAKMAEVTMNLQPSRVSVVVKDDGQGFDVARTEANLHKNKNLGLLSMRERAELEKGTLEIRSQPGRGTEVKVEIALPKR